ncbi:MAG: hypothetical protein H6849_01190 [Alphaproteobacteria bacterium]|nr:MAG: hypothetical protein H6849_01190 [Alphaproteobacteria bacterium]
MSYQQSFVMRRITQLHGEQATISSRLNAMKCQKVINPFVLRELQTQYDSVSRQITHLRGQTIPDIIA